MLYTYILYIIILLYLLPIIFTYSPSTPADPFIFSRSLASSAASFSLVCLFGFGFGEPMSLIQVACKSWVRGHLQEHGLLLGGHVNEGKLSPPANVSCPKSLMSSLLLPDGTWRGLVLCKFYAGYHSWKNCLWVKQCWQHKRKTIVHFSSLCVYLFHSLFT